MKIYYFAWVRERIGLDQEEVEPPAHVRDVSALIEWLGTRSPGHASAFAEPSRVRAAVDNQFAGFDAPVRGAAEVAFFPPVTGG